MDTLQSAPVPVNGRGPTAAEAEAVAKLIGHPPVNAPRRTTRQLYGSIDIHGRAPAWPASIPPMSEPESVKAAQLLYRRFYQERFYQERHGMSRAAYYRKLGRKPPPVREGQKVRITSGNRNNWMRRGVLIVNPGGGWQRLVHDLSHYFHWRLRPKDRPHSDSHRHLESEMIEHVVSSGWLAGSLKPKPRTPRAEKPKVDPLQAEHDKAAARLTALEATAKALRAKVKRNATAIGKAKKDRDRLARRLQKQIRFSLTD